MRKVAVYVEGGGNVASQKAELRKGFEELFREQRQLISTRGSRLDFIFCGSRHQAYSKFINEIRQNDNSTVVALLVDAEMAVMPEKSSKSHLEQSDGWDLKKVDAERIHLMVECMETWIVADPDAVATYYGKNFRHQGLPTRANLEEVPKSEVYDKLAKATKDTSKGAYSGPNHSKIRHASELLLRIDAKKVAARCSRFQVFIGWLDDQFMPV